MGKGENAGNQRFLLFIYKVFLILSQTSPGFTCLQYKSFKYTLAKREIARNCHFHQIQNCCLQFLSVWKSLKFVVWERVNRIIELMLTYIDSEFVVCIVLRIWKSPKFRLFWKGLNLTSKSKKKICNH